MATASAHGSQSPGKTDFGPLAGKQDAILPDNDVRVQKYAETVAGLLMSLDPPALVKVLDLPHLPDKGDIEHAVRTRLVFSLLFPEPLRPIGEHRDGRGIGQPGHTAPPPETPTPHRMPNQ